jgi:membrane protease YdiL (CAAX protease family)
MKPVSPERIDPSRDTRRLVLYFGGLILVYVVAVIAFWNADDKSGVFIAIMFAPTVGALLARFAGPGIIQLGRLSWWILAGLIPTVAVLLAYLVGTAIGVDSLETEMLLRSLISAPIAILTACLSAVGEEIGWRGFLWPLLRNRFSFLRTSLLVGIVWWLYHVPLILFGWYGMRSGIPAFTVAIAGFTLFVGVITDRSRSVWPSLIAHGAWNALVATGFAVTTSAGIKLNAFTGSTTWVGEFGWLAAIASLIVGIVATIWHLRRPDQVNS